MINRLNEVRGSIPKAVKEVEAAIQMMVHAEKATKYYINSKTKEISNIYRSGYDWQQMNLWEYATMNNWSVSLDSFVNSEIEEENVNRELFVDYVCGGGFPCDIYLKEHTKIHFAERENKNPFKDVDFFVNQQYVNEDFLKDILPDVEDFQVEEFMSTRYAEMFDTIGLITFTYEGIKFEIVKVYSMLRVETFDFRFRNFFYKQNRLYATKGALEDVQNKEINLQSPHSPISSLIRGFYLERKYGFQFNKTSIEWILWTLSKFRYDISRFDNAIRTRAETEEEVIWYKDKIQEYIIYERDEFKNDYERLTSPVAIPIKQGAFPFAEEFENIWRETPLSEPMYNSLLSYKPNPFQNIVIEFKPIDKTGLFNLIKKYDTYFSDKIYGEFFEKVLEVEEDQSLDFGVFNEINYPLLRKFADKSVVEKMDLLLHPNNEAKEFYKYLETLKGLEFEYEELEAELENLIKLLNTVDSKVRFTLHPTLHVCAVEGEVLTVEIESAYNQCLAQYTFRKVERGLYTLSNTESLRFEYYEPKFIYSFIGFMKGHFPDVFDYGQPGDIAKEPITFDANEHFFRSEYQKGYVFLQKQEMDYETYVRQAAEDDVGGAVASLFGWQNGSL